MKVADPGPLHGRATQCRPFPPPPESAEKHGAGDTGAPLLFPPKCCIFFIIRVKILEKLGVKSARPIRRAGGPHPATDCSDQSLLPSLSLSA